MKQHDKLDCGVACLEMIIEFYHGYMTVERLTDMIGITTKGVSAYQLIQTAKQIGFQSYGIELKTVTEEPFHLPAIAHMKTLEGYYHYVVIYKINAKQGTLIIADPASGIRTMSIDEFNLLWTHVVCIFYPIRALPILDKRNSLNDIVLSILKPYYCLLGKIMFLSIIYGIFSLAANFYVTTVINMVGMQNKSLLWIILGIMIIVYLFKNITDYFRNLLLLLFHERVSFFLVSDVLKRLIFLPYQYYQNRTSGEVIAKLNELVHLQNYVEKMWIFLSFDCILFLISFYVLMRIDASLLFFYSVILFIDLFLWILLRRVYIKRQYQLQLVKASTNQTLTESLIAFESIKGLHLEKNVLAQMSKHYLQFIKHDIHYQLLHFRHQLLSVQLHDVGYVVSIFLLAMMLLERKHTVAEIITYQTFIGYMRGSVAIVAELITSYQQAKVALEQLAFLFQKQEEKLQLSRNIKGKIELKKLHYELEQKDVLLDQCSLVIKQAQKVLLLGSSGSGKSTLMKIIMGYYKINRGQVFIDDVDLLDYSKDSISASIVYMNQFGTLFTDTLYYNIVLNRRVDMKTFDDVVKLCAIDEILNKRGTDLSMRLEENGMNLSGGERQRILLARALLTPFQILLIDEGLSQVDHLLEEKILKRLFLKYYDKTIILVSHRRKYSVFFHQVLEIKKQRIEVVS